MGIMSKVVHIQNYITYKWAGSISRCYSCGKKITSASLKRGICLTCYLKDFQRNKKVKEN